MLLNASPPRAQMFAPPSPEARFLLRAMPWLFVPRDRQGPFARFTLMAIVAPMTQFTFVSFDLQAFLFLVFHRRWTTLLGHGVFMTIENVCIMAALRGMGPVATPAGALDPALPYALLLAIWYAVIARQERLWLWAGLMALLVAGLYALSFPLAATFTAHGVSPWAGVFASGLMLAFSHIPEAALPPRVADPLRWTPVIVFLREPGLTPWQRLGRVFRLALFPVLGALDEVWAAPRLMAYNYLNLMMHLGYAPALARRLRGWSDAAWRDGQPALDYVGTGGGTFLSQVIESPVIE